MVVSRAAAAGFGLANARSITQQTIRAARKISFFITIEISPVPGWLQARA